MLLLRFNSDSTSGHEIFIKEHNVRAIDETKPSGKTLFVLNIPPYADEKSLKNVFSQAGQVSKVIIESNLNNEGNSLNNGFKVAYIVYKTRESLLKSLKMTSLRPLSCCASPVSTGMPKWLELYNQSICDPELLAKQANQYMSRFDKTERKKTQQKEEVDEDGWTVVTKKSRTPGLSRKESVVNKLNEKIDKGAKKKELKNFYTFQIRESKMKDLAELRKSYEEAKTKVKQMKSVRRFKPY